MGTSQVQLDALHRLAHALAGGEFRAHAVLSRACVAVAEAFGFERVGIVRYVAQSAMLIPFAAHGLTEEETAALPAALPIGRFGAFGTALETRRAFVGAGSGGPEPLPDGLRAFGLGAFVIVPLVSEGRCLGFLTCDHRGAPFELEASEVDLLTTFGALIAAFVERAIEHSELRRLNELKSQFAALASHELRTPAAAIFGAVRTFEEYGDRLSEEHRAQLWSVLLRQSERLNELVENLLDLSRLEAESLRLAPVEVDVDELLREIVAAVAERPEDVDVRVAAGERVMVDPNVVDRIVSNLLSNALRHGAPPVAIVATTAERQLVVTVEDHGPGVDAELVETLFDRFTRGSSPSGEGAGLGLSIARAYARAHGGSISYRPAAPRGAAFVVEIPVGPEARRAQ